MTGGESAAAIPIRLTLSRAAGFDLQELSRATNGLDAVVVTRPGLFGNPYVHPDPAKAVEAFRRHSQPGTRIFTIEPGGLQFARRIHRNSLHWAWAEWLRDEGLRKIRGRNLACWCKQGAPCHADVLLELANARGEP